MEEKVDVEKLMELLTMLNVSQYRYCFQNVINGPPAICESRPVPMKQYQLLSTEPTVKRLREAVEAVERVIVDAKAFLARYDQESV